ncbi:MAG TPA: biotin/lipoate A/B protein ligase family protein [Methylomirabilota bacterium]|nr:biotin/lipoate A/B protein ligase family protein [Methylomirabilota bacterium]
MAWRYIADDGVSAAFGLAADEVVTRRQGTAQSPPTLRLYTYQPCALVGRFQRLPSELRVEECLRLGMEINRRPTGGGAIIMGPGQLGVAVMTPAPADARTYDRTRELFGRFGAGVIAGLATLGIGAEYRRKNDVEVGRRKIAGLGIAFDPAGGLLFHASLLVDLDITLMLSALRTPFEKISDKEIATVAERMTTVTRELGRPVALDEVRERAREGYELTLGAELVPGGFTPEELAEIQALERERYRTQAWLEREPATPDAMGSATVKTEGGLLTAHLTLAGEVIKAVYLTGDFFTDDAVLAGMERALRWHPVAPDAVLKTVEGLREREGLALLQVPSEAVARAVALAADAAREHVARGLAKGCFVNP